MTRHPDPARLQAEALFARRSKKRTPYHTSDKGDPTWKVDRSTKRQTEAYFEGKDPSQSVTATEVDTSKAVVRKSDLAKTPAQLHGASHGQTARRRDAG